MLGIRDVYEVAIKVRDLAVAEPFHRDVLGSEVGLRDARRPWIFMRAGAGGMIVLQPQPDVPQQHFAFTVSEHDIDAAAEKLRRRDAAVDGPMIHEWIGRSPHKAVS
jgi:predicted enzyme related to lactoylglutathione lyase